MCQPRCLLFIMVAMLDSYEAEALWLAGQGHVITGELSDWLVDVDDVIKRGNPTLIIQRKQRGFLVSTANLNVSANVHLKIQ